MSIDLRIVPTKHEIITWEAIKTSWISYLGDASLSLLGNNPQLLKGLEDNKINWGKNLNIIDFSDENDRHFLLDISVRNSMMLSFYSNEYSIEEALIPSYAYNISSDERDFIISSWKLLGYYMLVSSYPRRSDHESVLMISLCCALADITSGYILFDQTHSFDATEGIYKPSEFKDILPKF